MIEINNFEFQRILYSKENITIYIVKNTSSGKLFIAKRLSEKYPSFSDISSLKNEFEITNKLNSNGVIQAHSFIANNNNYAFIKEYFEGCTLKEYISKNRVNIRTFLEIACQISKTLNEVHLQGIIHKDINPSNIIYNPKTNEVKLTDFSIAAENTQEKISIDDEEIINGTPLYLSPEQTGRIDRTIDYRTDLYSLGITFYEILTGRLPFYSHKVSEVIHMHLSVIPDTPHNIYDFIPEQISQIIMRLLQKNAEDRYQNALELLVDLEQCVKNLSINNTDFILKTRQSIAISQFSIPNKLYGRENEIKLLNNAFKSTFIGQKRIILVKGNAGVGKTSLIKSINKSNSDHCGIEISGKFEQSHKNIPYYGFVQGLTIAIRKILRSNSNDINYWRERFISSLGKNINLLVNIIPELNIVLQIDQIEIRQVIPESQAIFIQTLETFIQSFGSKKHPIVLFLDDLQWADFASLELLTSLANSKQSKYILFILAYRHVEISKLHPFNRVLSDLNKKDLINHSIELQPLSLSSAKDLVADTLNCDLEYIDFLANLIFQKSGGNPFFLIQLLKTLYQDKYIYFDYAVEKWNWNIERILKSSITDFSVLELLSRNIQKLPKQTQDLIQYCSCIGSQFDLITLAGISHKTKSELTETMFAAIDSGLIVSTQDSYESNLLLEDDIKPHFNIYFRFVHDYIQQAIYLSIPESEKSSLHLLIGDFLLRKYRDSAFDKKLFEIIKHFNKGIHLVDDLIKKNELAELNFIAGNKSKLAAAYESACEYYKTASVLSKKYCLENFNNSSTELYLSLLECLYISSERNQADSLAIKLIHNAKSLSIKISVYELQIAFCFTQNQPLQSIDKAIEALNLLNVKLPNNPNKIELLFNVLRAKISHRNLTIESLTELPVMSDEKSLAAMRVLMTVVPAAFVARPNLFPLAILKMVNLSISYGNSPVSGFAYNSYGTIYNVVFNDIEKCCSYSDLSLQLLEKFSSYEIKPAIYLVGYAFNKPWKYQIRSLLTHLSNASNYALEIGDVENLGHCSAFYCILSFFSGKPLSEVIDENFKYIDILSSYKQYFQCTHLSIWAQVSENYVDTKLDVSLLEGSFFNEEEQSSDILHSSNDLIIFPFYLAKMILSFYYKKFDEALHLSNLLNDHIDGVNGIIYIAIYYFYYCLTLLALCSTQKIIVRRKYLIIVNRIIHRFKKWAKACPENFSNKYFLIKAEYYRVINNFSSSSKYYDKAIESSKSNLFLQEEALANELAAEFYFSNKNFKISALYFKESCYAYFNWGALSKIEDIKYRYSNISEEFKQIFTSYQKDGNNVKLSSSETLGNIDLRTVIETSQAISEEIIRDKLLNKILEYLIELAGATQAYLILYRDENLYIEATASMNSSPIVKIKTELIKNRNDIPHSILNYIFRTKENVVINDTREEHKENYNLEIYFNLPKSLLGMPIISQGKLIGIVYLENDLVYDAFKENHLETIRILCAQAAISLENAYLYEDLQQSQAREQAEREINELKSRFISMTSHEFRTPLTAILGTTELIKHYGQGWDTNKQHTYLDRIQKNVKHMTGLLDDVLVLSKADVNKVEFNPKLINLEVFCSSLVEEFQLNTKRDQQIEFEFFWNQHEVYSDEKILRQILSNLLSNAIKYSPESTSVRFQVNVNEEEATFFIKDQGIGIPEADQQHLFESFHRATNVGQIQGTGLGLAIVKKSVELHRGTIDFESIADQGTTFIVKLPITAEALGIESH